MIWLWYDMIWYDMIWYDMIWYDMTWYNLIWYEINLNVPYVPWSQFGDRPDVLYLFFILYRITWQFQRQWPKALALVLTMQRSGLEAHRSLIQMEVDSVDGFGPPCGCVFYIFSFFSTDVPWGQRPAWNAMASACGRLQQWDRVLNQWLGIAGCGGQSTARLTLKGISSAFDGLFGNHIALGGFYIGFSSTEVSVVSVVSPFQNPFRPTTGPATPGGSHSCGWFFSKLPRLKLMATAPECWKFFSFFFWRTRTARLAVILIKHIWVVVSNTIFLIFNPYFGK